MKRSKNTGKTYVKKQRKKDVIYANAFVSLRGVNCTILAAARLMSGVKYIVIVRRRPLTILNHFGIRLQLFPLNGKIRNGCTFAEIIPLFNRM